MAIDLERGMYCLRCSGLSIVRGKIGESARFYPTRGVLEEFFAKPVFLLQDHSYACLECGLAWTEVDQAGLRENVDR